MNSFDDTLENLDYRPRYTDTEQNSRFRRVSQQLRRFSQPDPFLFGVKRERLDSGDFLTVPNSRTSQTKSDAYMLNSNKKSKFLLSEFKEKEESVLEEQIDKSVNSEDEIILEEEEEQLVLNEPEKKEYNMGQSDSTKESIPEKPIIESPKQKVGGFVLKMRKVDSKLVLNVSERSESETPSIPHPTLSELRHEINREDKNSNIIFGDQEIRIRAKIAKIITYWKSTSLLIPNVFRMIKSLNETTVLEFQDYSKKELLVQSNGLKFVPKGTKFGFQSKKKDNNKRKSKRIKKIITNKFRKEIGGLK